MNPAEARAGAATGAEGAGGAAAGAALRQADVTARTRARGARGHRDAPSRSSGWPGRRATRGSGPDTARSRPAGRITAQSASAMARGPCGRMPARRSRGGGWSATGAWFALVHAEGGPVAAAIRHRPARGHRDRSRSRTIAPQSTRSGSRRDPRTANAWSATGSRRHRLAARRAAGTDRRRAGVRRRVTVPSLRPLSRGPGGRRGSVGRRHERERARPLPGPQSHRRAPPTCRSGTSLNCASMRASWPAVNRSCRRRRCSP